MKLCDGMCQLTTTPVFQAMDLAAAHGRHGAVALDHGRDLFALIRMNQKHDFVMSHCCSLRVKAARTRGTARRIRDFSSAAGARMLPNWRVCRKRALADGLVKTNSCRHGHVKAVCDTVHRQTHDVIAAFSGESAQPFPLSAQHHRHRAC